MIFTLLRKLHRTRLLTFIGLYRLLEAIWTTGVNLMALLRIAAKLHPERIAVIDDQEELTYARLWKQAEAVAVGLQRDCGIQPRQRIAIAARNHAAAIKAIFAVSRLGADVFLVNPEMSADQIRAMEHQLQFDYCIYDPELTPVVDNLSLSHKAIPTYRPSGTSVDRMSVTPPSTTPLRKVKTGKVVVMTGGTTGQPKPASRKPSLFDFLPPFIALLSQVHLDRYRTVYIATPIYHGFGLAALLIGVTLGAQQYFTRRFDAGRACDLIAQDNIEVITLVPLMLQRMLTHNAPALSSLQRILTGGAALRPALAQATLEQLGPVLFNLYGTSEAGLCILADPDLLQRQPDSIGKPIIGVQVQIQSDGPSEKGQLCIRSAWAAGAKGWIETGDLAYRDGEGNLFLGGRVDDMIVSGGENVYPLELENVLLQHPGIEAAVVLGIPDPEFGQRLKAIIIPKPAENLEQATVLAWLKPRVARYQMPAVIEFRQALPYTSLGKLNRKAF
ncbi:AMP-binding protein [Acaryochloris sp. IP29b_bin.148]|uniref:AMP-binding protein n=1 Tax=Acaryochloris sp. IP29b_bin.148 TaxID=2969218 RepID=UPI0026103BB4|nr:AMP-binding protein [Acaryochloris sp. IP29b_bin.148]